MPKLSHIVALSENRVIGAGNKLPWHIPEDLKRFKALTAGHPVVMGRKTYESIGKLLPKRTNIIVTRQKDFAVEGALVAHSVEDALRMARESPGAEEIFIIGGGVIFKETLGIVDKLYLTYVHARIEGDAFYPEIPSGKFRETFREKHESSSGSFSFVDMERA